MKYQSLSGKALKAIPDAELKHDRDNLAFVDILNISYAEKQRYLDELKIVEAEISRRPIMKAERAFKDIK